ncbi:MAG TPA: ABC-2 family transporter protein [Candidatus Saccharimonadales bacterium]|nr:ABC-2 family transporter protein [Candidatus Saccharimonadales bacterium]
MVANVLRHIRHDLRVYRASLIVQFKAAAALRGAFIMQIIGMMVNNSALVAAWLFFFHQFGTVNGWSGVDFIGMMGVNALVFGLTSFLCVGLMDMPRHVDTGSMDAFLTKPTSVLGNVASSNMDITTVGDMLFGIGVLLWYAIYKGIDPLAVLPFALMLVVACVVFWCFVLLLPNVIAFYLFDSERISRSIGVFFLGAGEYPAGVLTGPIRTGLLLGVPALFYAAVPLDVLRGVHWELIGVGVVVAAFWLTFSLWLFRRALNKYESANLIGAR